LDLRTIEALIFPEAASSQARTGPAGASEPSGSVVASSLESAPANNGGDRGRYERFTIPYLFQPALSVAEAVRATLRTFLRIFLGSLLFGVWGAYALLLWTSVRNPFLRVAAMIPMIALFLVLLCGLLIGTTLLVRPRARQFTQL
jgi:hypothetical protein